MNNGKVYSRNEIRELDRMAIEDYGIPGCVLMENAGRGIFEYMCSKNVDGLVIICCGKGNNGGDGFVLARYLHNHKVPVKIFIFAKPSEIKGDAKIFLHILEKMNLPIYFFESLSLEPGFFVQEFLSATWIVDALFGTGLAGVIKEPYTTVINTINNSDAIVLSVDIPSGLDCDNGKELGVFVKADHTVTFVGAKMGFKNSKTKRWLGNIKIVDIGIPKQEA